MLANSQQQVIDKLVAHVLRAMPPECTAHDWPHINRVLKQALRIQAHEGGDAFSISVIALVHDLYDHKFFTGTTIDAKAELMHVLCGYGILPDKAAILVKQVFALSYSKGNRDELALEGKIVQDADRLEAIGAIGIARAFAYGGFKQRVLHNTPTFVFEHKTYGNAANEPATFDHFFEKLLKLYDLLNTNTAKAMAKDRFVFMQEFVKRFEGEWDLNA